MTDTDMIRTPAPRPPYQTQSQNPIVRPNLNQIGPRQMLPQQQQQQQQQNLMASTNGQQQRPLPSPLRRLDSKGNIVLNIGQPRLPGPPGPTGPQQMNRPPLPPGSVQNPGIQQHRPPTSSTTNWSSLSGNQPQGQQQRPQFQQNNNPQQQQQQQNPQMRPPFPRAPGQHPVSAPNQPQFRPPFPQQQPNQQQQQPQQQQPLQQQQGRPMQLPKTASIDQMKPPPITNPYQNNNEDDDDVVIGQAITPQKSMNKPGTGLISNPMTQSQYGTLMDDNNKTESSYSTRITNQKNEINISQNYKDLVDDQRTTKSIENNPRENVNLEQLNIYGNKSPGQLQLTRKQIEDSHDFSSIGKQQQQQQQQHHQQHQQQHQQQININQKAQPLKQSGEMNNPDRHSAIQQKTYTELKKIKKGDNDSGVDESTQGNDRNGPASPGSPLKTPTQSGISRPPSATPSNKSNKSRSASRSRLLLKTPEPEQPKKVPMNKVKVGNAPSPDLKAVRSKIGSLDNSSYKPGGGNVRISTTKLHIKAAPRIEAKNDKYVPQGGDKKITSTKLQWNAKSKINSLENANHKPGGGDKKIETIKSDFKDKAKPKVGSKDNVKYMPGGGDIKTKSKEHNQSDIQTQKIDIKAQSKIGSMDNVKHRPGGGDKKIFDDKDYLKNVDHPVALTPPTQDPPAVMTESSGADENLNKQQS